MTKALNYKLSFGFTKTLAGLTSVLAANLITNDAKLKACAKLNDKFNKRTIIVKQFILDCITTFIAATTTLFVISYIKLAGLG